MVDDKDINKLTSLLATKKDVEEIKSDLGDLKELVQGLIVSSDSLAKSISDLTLEYAAISTQLQDTSVGLEKLPKKLD